MKKIAVFASGNGSNAVNLIEYFENHPKYRVTLLLCNKKDAPVIKKAEDRGVKTKILDKTEFYQKSSTLDFLREEEISFIVLAGFLWLVPEYIIKTYENKVINIHPALLPNYGGPGMYGMKVHRAVIENREQVSGITIHFANESYDEGQRIFQAKCKVVPDEDSPEALAGKIKILEQNYFPVVTESVMDKIYS